MAFDWSEGIPSDLIALLVSRLTIADYIRSGAVCTSWRRAVVENQHRRDHPETPWLIVSGGEQEDLPNFFNLGEQKIYRFHLPQIRGMRWLGSSDGWLVAMDDLAELHLLNPFTGAGSRLPSITTFSYIKGVEHDPNNGNITGYMYQMYNDDPIFHDLEYMQKYYFNKVVFFPAVSIAVAIHSVNQDLAIARLGDESWTELQCPYPFFQDVILHKGQFYAVTVAGLVVAYDLGSPSSPPMITFNGPYSTFLNDHRHYLVESLDGDDLLQVCRDRISGPWEPDQDDGPSYFGEWVRRTASFKIFRLDRRELQWVEVRSLGKRSALFLGYNHSKLISTKDLPELKGNCIYFTEDTNTNYASTPHAKRDMGVFNLEDGSIEPFFPPGSLLNRLNWPPPIWITPALS